MVLTSCRARTLERSGSNTPCRPWPFLVAFVASHDPGSEDVRFLHDRVSRANSGVDPPS